MGFLNPVGDMTPASVDYLLNSRPGNSRSGEHYKQQEIRTIESISVGNTPVGSLLRDLRLDLQGIHLPGLYKPKEVGVYSRIEEGHAAANMERISRTSSASPKAMYGPEMYSNVSGV
jgi:hypothetical protein